MAEDSHGWCFGKEELYYTKYFDRCRDVGMSKSEISSNLGFLDKYYQEDYISKLPTYKLHWKKYTSVHVLFVDWCDNNLVK